MSDIRTVIDWLSDGARSAQLSEDVLEELCRGMAEAGIPLWRVAVFVTTLHPDLMGRAFRWWSESGVQVSEAQYDIKETDDYLKSPVVAVYGTRQPLRRKLADPNCPIDFAVLNEFRAEGATDYVAFPLVFTDGSVHVATWSTRQPGGFTPKQYVDLEQVIAPLTRVAEIRALRRTATNLPTPMSDVRRASGFSPAGSGVAMSRQSMRRSGCPTCAASPRARSGCRRRT
jgi:adenylate cyclase